MKVHTAMTHTNWLGNGSLGLYLSQLFIPKGKKKKKGSNSQGK